MSSSQLNEETVSININGLKLEGTLSTPTEQSTRQVVLLIAGSGPLDRNQNSTKIKLNIFNQLAAHLAQGGVASLRYDKRGCGNSQGDYDSSGHSELVSDALEWARFLKQSATFSETPLFILGHSEGSLIAPQVATKDTNIVGQILISPFLENFETLLGRQAKQSLTEIAKLPGFKGKVIRFFLWLSGDQIAKQRKLIRRIKDTSQPTIRIKSQTINAKWMRELMNTNAEQIHAAVTIPTLAIGGAKDVQCLPSDVDKLQRIVKGPIQTHIIDDLTHILRRDLKSPSTQHYSDLMVLPIDEELLGIISKWLQTQSSNA